MYEQVFLKEGGESGRTPWHQDSSYLPIDGSQIARDVDFVRPGRKGRFARVRARLASRRHVRRVPLRSDDDTAPIYGDGSLPRLPNIEAERSRWDIVSWAVEPGDVLVFHPGVCTAAPRTHRGRRRRTLSLRFFGPDAVYASRPGMSGKRRPVDDPEATCSRAPRPRFRPAIRCAIPAFRNCVPPDDGAAHLPRSAAGQVLQSLENPKPSTCSDGWRMRSLP